MSYLVDTNVISELARSRPEPRVVAWLEAAPTDSLHLSVLSLGELRRGVERLPAGRRRERLRNWMETDLRDWFGPRLLTVDAEIAERWGRLLAAASRTLPVVDGLLAATALRHDLRLVTRNARDFGGTGVELVDPWVG